MDLNELVEFARKNGRAAFTSRFPHLFLILSGRDTGRIGFDTEIASAANARVSAAQTVIEDLVPVTKGEGNPYPERIAVGRARNCDMVLRDRSVSKLHAHFLVEGVGFLLVDLGSSNGTRINGDRLRPERPAPLMIGDVIHFGKVRTQLVDAAELFRRL